MKKYYLKTVDEVVEFFKDFGQSYSFDTETTSLSYTKLKIEGISFCDGHKSCYIPFLNRNLITEEVNWENPETTQIIEELKNVFMESKTVVMHNAVFDMKVILKYGINLEGKKIYDTMIADHLIDENRRHGLKHLAEKLLNKDTTSYKELKDSGSSTFYEYACNDAEWTWELCLYQQPIMREENLVEVFRDIEMPFQFALLDMQVNGMLVDTKRMRVIRKELVIAVNNLNEELHNSIGEVCNYQSTLNGGIEIIPSVNFGSSKVLQDILFNKLKLKVVEKTPGGAPSTGKTTINAYKASVPFVGLLHRYKISNKLLTAYFSENGQIIRNLDEDNKVRPSFRDTGTTTGRLSCSEPNLQQLPKTLCWKCGSDKIEDGVCKDCGAKGNYHTRACFISGSGRKMITCDYSGQEICVMAEISKDPTLVKSLNNGYDMHLAIANQFYELGIPEECLSKTNEKYKEYKTKFKSQRTQAKTITFGLAYGKGAYGFAKDFGVSEEEAQEIVDNYFAGMPKLLSAINNSHEEVKEHGYVTYLSGRKRHFHTVTRDEWTGYTKKSLRQAFNAKIQGYSADMMRMAMNAVRRDAKKFPEYDLKLEATVHDELITTCKEEYLEECCALIKKAMEGAVTFCVPVTADVGVGENYDEAK